MVDKSFITNLFRLDNQVALVTGAGQNIGQGLALALGLSGARIAIIDQDQHKADTTKRLLEQHQIEVISLTADITATNQVENYLASILSQWGKLDIAVNNVGLCYGSDAEQVTYSDWKKIIDVNLNATFYNCQKQFNVMRANSYGKIINIASVAGVLVPHPQNIVAYNTAKAAIIHLTRSLAAEWAKTGIAVNAISPGTIHMPDFESEAMHGWLTNWQQQIPMGRLAHIEDLFGAVIFLASKASNYMVGQNLIVDGGHTLW